MTKKILDQLLKLAADQLGVREATGQNDGEPSRRYMGGRREPWCAHFIAWLFRSVGHPLPGDVVATRLTANPIASVARMKRELMKRELYFDKEVKTTISFDENGAATTRNIVPVPGCLAFFSDRGDSDASATGQHVELVIGVDADHFAELTPDGIKAALHLSIITIGGNVSDGGKTGLIVGTRKHDVDKTKRLVGFGFPFGLEAA